MGLLFFPRGGSACVARYLSASLSEAASVCGPIERTHWSLAGNVFQKAFRGNYGDHRDWRDIDAWADGLARELRAATGSRRSDLPKWGCHMPHLGRGMSQAWSQTRVAPTFPCETLVVPPFWVEQARVRLSGALVTVIESPLENRSPFTERTDQHGPGLAAPPAARSA